MGQADPIHTPLKTEALPTTATAYEAKYEGISQSERDAFRSCKDSSARIPTQSSHPNLEGIPNMDVRNILQRLIEDDGFAYKAWDGT